MQAIKTIIQTTEQLTTGLNKLNPIVTTDNCNAQEADQIFEMSPSRCPQCGPARG